MATITATHLDAPQARTGRLARARTAIARATRAAATAVSTARLPLSPVLTATGLGCIDIAAWETFGRGAAWLALGISVLLFEYDRSHD